MAEACRFSLGAAPLNATALAIVGTRHFSASTFHSCQAAALLPFPNAYYNVSYEVTLYEMA